MTNQVIDYRQAYERLREAAVRACKHAKDHGMQEWRVFKKLRKALDAPLPELQPTPCPDRRCPDLQAHKIEAVLKERIAANFSGEAIDAKYLRLISDVVQYELGGRVP